MFGEMFNDDRVLILAAVAFTLLVWYNYLFLPTQFVARYNYQVANQQQAIESQDVIEMEIKAMEQVGPSDSTSVIEQELMNTNLNGLDKELDDIETGLDNLNSF